jgi:N-carbamoylputrescine amidase
VDERYFFAPGDLGFPVVTTPSGVRVGVIICYERNLPEPARCIALNGADVLVVPVTTTPEARPVWEMLLRTRALENGLYVVAPSRVGLDEGGAEGVAYIGESLVISPTAAILGHGSASSEDLVVVDLDPALLGMRREGWSYVKDRRPEIYDVLAAVSTPASSPEA